MKKLWSRMRHAPAQEPNTPPVCNWRDGVTCQFAGVAGIGENLVSEWQGRHYCRAHLPLAAGVKDHLWMKAFSTSCTVAQFTRFEGVQWPGGRPQERAAYRLGGIAPNLRHCVIGQHTTISVNTQDADLSDSEFSDDNELNQVRGGFRCLGSVFRGRMRIHPDAGARIDFTGTEFMADAEFVYVNAVRTLTLDRCKFHRAPNFILSDAHRRLPQDCTFIKASFEKTAQRAGDEPIYRDIRNLFHQNRAREWEGFFYALEKRCHRLSIPKWPPNHWIARFLSKMYDLSSAYGQSYERALLAFLTVQVVFGIGYWIATGQADLRGEFDPRLVAFTASQALKPFELLSARNPDNWFYGLIPADRGWWVFCASLQSALSLTLVALFLLAVRWRFRRE